MLTLYHRHLILLSHTSIRTTEKSYVPRVKARQERLEGHSRGAWNLDLESGDLGHTGSTDGHKCL